MTKFLDLMTEALTLQDMLNTQLYPDWKTRNLKFLLAAKIEAVEAIDHIGWKWWKHQEPDIEQAFVELVDILHFMLSAAMVCRPVDKHSELAKKIVEALPEYNIPSLDSSAAVEVLEFMLGELASADLTSAMDSLFIAANYLGYSFLDLLKAYVSKNALNVFRQSNGYKTGTYKKIWNGEEDNVVMMRIVKELDEVNFNNVYRQLELEYEKVEA